MSERRRVAMQAGLFFITLITTTLAGAEWTYGKSVFQADFTINDFFSGLPFSIPFLLILTVHEFGHYFTAVYHKVRTSLPYYIPIPPIPFVPLTLGTMGAVIRLRSRVPSNVKNFDIGIAGPLAGFIMALGILFYGFTHLPEPSYIFSIHPEYEEYGLDYADHVYSKEGIIDITIGKNLLFLFFEKYVADPERMPNEHEIMHYPFLFAGFLALIFTSLNLMPIGQLDGGHVVYGLLGFKRHKRVASIAYVLFMLYAGIGCVRPGDDPADLVLYVPMMIGILFFSFKGLRLPLTDTWMYALIVFAIQFALAAFFPDMNGYTGWLLFGFIIGRMVGVEHPPCDIEVPLSTGRKILGWIAILIFIICFSPSPIELTITGH